MNPHESPAPLGSAKRSHILPRDRATEAARQPRGSRPKPKPLLSPRREKRQDGRTNHTACSSASIRVIRAIRGFYIALVLPICASGPLRPPCLPCLPSPRPPFGLGASHRLMQDGGGDPRSSCRVDRFGPSRRPPPTLPFRDNRPVKPRNRGLTSGRLVISPYRMMARHRTITRTCAASGPLQSTQGGPTERRLGGGPLYQESR
jgi:hypothetical protein